ncbi:Na+/H+ antiporter NhaC family protein [Salinivibrio sp. ES.052]|uniref:Na+/H+ antiporter NhaC family protein n=1 Tax=Salinivibrio sp. ES.052 TaxID=1882823 RepID=UPI000925BCBA|nr:Na+/H+ antiporter NhaC family protein [Salinivibrio sp. ES.052]SIN93539.1 transporter, NhaC family [Salinivibrio sp. ES.052]
MNLTDFSSSALSLLPPLLALGLAIATRRVLLSLGMGIVLGTVLLNDASLIPASQYLLDVITGLFIADGGLNSWNLSILAFLILLGMITALLSLSGGTRAFANWAQSRIKSKRGATLLAAFLGVFIFVDDYFNSLAVGAVSRPVTDRFHVSRAKLAYILDSTAAPMCVITPASSWGAYIITVIGSILVAHGVTDYSALGAFVTMIPMNFYAIFALLLVFAVVWFQLDIGPMRQFEYQAQKGSRLGDESEHCADICDDLGIEESVNGTVADLVAPIVMLVFATVGAMLFTGGQALAADHHAFSILGAFENTDVGMSLLWGGLAGLLVALTMTIKQRIAVPDIAKTLWVGAKSMFGAILILLFAWSIGHIIGDLQTGQYLSSLVQGNLSPQLLPVVLFLLAAVMAFATGTSWGTFGIMLPIAGDLAAATDIALMLPMLSAVLAGAVFGDHCSPISDTTILSSTGARCGHIDHVATQLPYAIGGAVVSTFGFLVLGFTASLLWSLAATTLAFIMLCAGLLWLKKRPSKRKA